MGFDGDEAMTAFVQRSLGYNMYGAPIEKGTSKSVRAFSKGIPSSEVKVEAADVDSHGTDRVADAAITTSRAG